MKNIKYKWALILAVVLIASILLSKYIADSRSYSVEELSAFIASCGSFIQSGFRNDKPAQWDYFIVVLSAFVVLVTFYYSIKYLIKPDENKDHIKYQILENEKEC